MSRVEEEGDWSLFDPVDVPTLNNLCGVAFSEEYRRLEHTVTPLHKVKARDLWLRVLQVQAETGSPFIMYSDSING